MGSIVVRFPDGSKEFRFPDRTPEEGDVVWHDGDRYRVVSVVVDEGVGQLSVTVEPDSDDLGDVLRSERGALELVPAE